LDSKKEVTALGWSGCLSRLECFLESKVLFKLLLAMLGFTLLTCLVQSMAYEEFHYVEFEIISFAMLWARGVQPYQDLFTVMAPVGFYTPLCYLGPAALGILLGTRHSPHLFLLTFRLLVFAYMLGTLLLTYRLTRRVGGHRNLAIMVCSLLIGGAWCTLSARPDWQSLFYVALSLFIVSSKEELSARSAILTGFFLALAFLHYQRHLSLFVAVLVYLLIGKQFRIAVRLASAFMVTALLCLGPLSLITRGRLLIHCFWIPAVTFIPTRGMHIIFQLAGFPLYGLAVMAGCGFIFLALQARTGFVRLMRIYAPLACLSALITMQSAGATTNHLLEPVFALSVWLVLFIVSSLRSGVISFSVRRSAGILFFAFALFYPLKNVVDSEKYWRSEIKGATGKYDWTVGHEKELERLRGGSMLTDDPAVSFRTNHPESCFESWYYTRVLIPKGFFDSGPSREKIRRQSYSWIVLDPQEQVYTLFKEELAQTYRFAGSIGPRNLWIPLTGRPAGSQ